MAATSCSCNRSSSKSRTACPKSSSLLKQLRGAVATLTACAMSESFKCCRQLIYFNSTWVLFQSANTSLSSWRRRWRLVRTYQYPKSGPVPLANGFPHPLRLHPGRKIVPRITYYHRIYENHPKLIKSVAFRAFEDNISIGKKWIRDCCCLKCFWFVQCALFGGASGTTT